MRIALWGQITLTVWTLNTVHALHQSASSPHRGGYIGLYVRDLLARG